jgi:tellurite resistance protein TehA-like permease
MLTAIAVLATLAFLAWLVLRALRGKPFKAHNITYALAIITGVYTHAFLLSMAKPQQNKIVISIIIGIALIFLAAYIQRRRQLDKPPDA